MNNTVCWQNLEKENSKLLDLLDRSPFKRNYFSKWFEFFSILYLIRTDLRNYIKLTKILLKDINSIEDSQEIRLISLNEKLVNLLKIYANKSFIFRISVTKYIDELEDYIEDLYIFTDKETVELFSLLDSKIKEKYAN